jgi:rhomboid family GlyGly-CTERM serine protease
VLALLLAGVELSGEWGRTWLQYDREAITAGQAWRLLTCSVVHLGWVHAALNIGSLAVLVLLCPQPLPWRVWVRRVVLISLGMSACFLVFEPQLDWYVGFSGVGYGLFVLGLGRQALQRDWISIVCLLFLSGRLVLEGVGGGSLTDAALIGGRVAIESHWYGSLTAVIYGLVFRAFTTLETWERR